MINIKRIYETAATTDGYRILVDRLWPRGMKKEDAQIDKWLKEVAPSASLRKWFNHEPEKWEQFMLRYQQELHDAPAFTELQADVRNHKIITLLFSAKNEQYNNAQALLLLLNKR